MTGKIFGKNRDGGGMPADSKWRGAMVLEG